MLSTLVKAAPRFVKVSSNFNHLSALCYSTNAKVIESSLKPTGQVPTDEGYYQIPVKIEGVDWVVDTDSYTKPYPFVPTLDKISLEKKASTVEADEQQPENAELEDEPRTLEDKLKVWFGEDMATKYDDQKPERDLVNFPRLPPQPEETPPTRLYFVPESWLKFFESKTGRSGGYAFFATFGTFLVSKELFVFNDNACIGVTMTAIAIILRVKFGDLIHGYLLGNVTKQNQGWIDWQDGMKKLLKDHVKELKQIEERSLNPELIYDAKRESLALQQEAEYRRRLVDVYNEVKRKLDYQVAVEDAKKNFTRRHLVNWVLENVNKNVNADLEKAVLKQCVVDLKTLSEKRRNAI